jgi:hypothetical protein
MIFAPILIGRLRVSSIWKLIKTEPLSKVVEVELKEIPEDWILLVSCVHDAETVS